MTKLCCLRCGKPIERKEWQRYESIIWMETTNNKCIQQQIDLCDSCLTKFYMWVGLDKLWKEE